MCEQSFRHSQKGDHRTYLPYWTFSPFRVAHGGALVLMLCPRTGPRDAQIWEAPKPEDAGIHLRQDKDCLPKCWYGIFRQVLNNPRRNSNLGGLAPLTKFLLASCGSYTCFEFLWVLVISCLRTRITWAPFMNHRSYLEERTTKMAYVLGLVIRVEGGPNWTPADEGA